RLRYDGHNGNDENEMTPRGTNLPLRSGETGVERRASAEPDRPPLTQRCAPDRCSLSRRWEPDRPPPRRRWEPDRPPLRCPWAIAFALALSIIFSMPSTRAEVRPPWRTAQPGLRVRLGSTDPEMRERTLLALASLGARAADWLPEITKLALDANPWVRRAAMRALASIGVNDSEIARVVGINLDHRHPFVREAALQTVATLAMRARWLDTAMLRLLDDADVHVRRAACRAIVRSRPRPTPKIVGALIRRLSDPNYGVMMEASRALGSLGVKALRPLLARIASGERWPRMAALYALWFMGERALRTIPQLVKLLDDRDAMIGRMAARILGRLGTRASVAVRALVRSLHHRSPRVREAAVVALGRIGAKAGLAAPTLLSLADDERKWIRREAEIALRKIGPPPPHVLSKAARDKRWRVRRAALQLLARREPKRGDALTALLRARKDAAWQVRAEIASSLRHFPRFIDRVAPALVEFLDDGNPRVVRAALKTTARLGPTAHAVLEKVLERLRHEDQWVRLASVRALVALESRSARTVAALIKRLDDTEEALREAAMHALLLLKADLPATTIRLLKRIATTSTPRNQRLALRLLARVGRGIELADEAVERALRNPDARVRVEVLRLLTRQRLAPSPSLRQQIVAQLEHDDASVRYAALKVVMRFARLSAGAESRLLIALLNDSDWLIRVGAVRALAHHRVSTAVSALIGALDDRHLMVRQGAVLALTSFPEARRRIITALRRLFTDRQPAVRRAIVRALGILRPPPNDALFSAALDDGSPMVRRAAIIAFGSYPSLPRALEVSLRRALHDSDDAVRRAAKKLFLRVRFQR
ncbi:MAG: HEAT repeat domain-containing protein, partial [Myxococcales bacterium]|nr:HEAT repeat domain-containing protein [Myxococcales bacterium]